MKSQSIQKEKIVFVPAEDIRSIEQVIDKLEQAQQEFTKAITSMLPSNKDKNNHKTK